VLLEKAGMTNLQTTDAVFRLPKEPTFDQAAELFGEFVRKNPIETDYALYAEFVGTPPETGVTEIRGIIVDRTGQSVWVDLQTPDDRDFKRAKPKPSEPMTCCHFLAERVRTLLGIPESARDDSGKGKFVKLWARKSSLPDKAELAAMEQRQAAMKKAGTSARVMVYPARLGGDHTDQTSATRLSKLLNEAKLCQATVAKTGPVLEGEGWPNEMRVLWLFARAARSYARQHPVDSDYVLFADYWFNPRGAVWAVHFVVCDRAGDWVIVELQNSHQEDFQRINPKSLADCDRLVLERLKKHLR
jgi:hypothetical protein